jgi:acetyl esterase/lipase
MPSIDSICQVLCTGRPWSNRRSSSLFRRGRIAAVPHFAANVPTALARSKRGKVPAAHAGWMRAILIGLSSIGFSVPSQAQEGGASAPTRVRTKYNIPYVEAHDPLQVADLYRPGESGTYPGVVMIHGGAWVAGDKLNDAGHARKLAERGYVVMVINYRLAPKHKHPAQIDDCFDALQWLSEHADECGVDTDRLGVFGYSAGGHLAALLATDPRPAMPRIKACVAGGAPCDLTMVPLESRLLAGFLGGRRQDLPEVYAQASPIEHVSEDDPPILLFHGEADQLVPIEYSERMRQRLIDANVTHEFLPLAKKSHIMAFVDRSAIDRSIAFFDRHLKQIDRVSVDATEGSGQRP